MRGKCLRLFEGCCKRVIRRVLGPFQRAVPLDVPHEDHLSYYIIQRPPSNANVFRAQQEAAENGCHQLIADDLIRDNATRIRRIRLMITYAEVIRYDVVID
ncbi:unnamed protein product [Clavelina lepadiformis]|uniref:Uncharacterized protein n=1 Tax=Clavelina lepadiformis TaxID=159417 RepID=A0ABP0EVR4_CLALP